MYRYNVSFYPFESSPQFIFYQYHFHLLFKATFQILQPDQLMMRQDTLNLKLTIPGLSSPVPKFVALETGAQAQNCRALGDKTAKQQTVCHKLPKILSFFYLSRVLNAICCSLPLFIADCALFLGKQNEKGFPRWDLSEKSSECSGFWRGDFISNGNMTSVWFLAFVLGFFLDWMFRDRRYFSWL